MATIAIATRATKFPPLMRALHWAMAVLVIGLLGFGLYMASIPLDSPDKFDLYHWHRALGVVALLLILVRLGVRWTLRRQVPAHPTLPRRERVAAEWVQVFFYAALIVMPVVGYVASSAVPDFPGVPPINAIWFFGAELPLAPVEKNYDTTVFFITIHEYLGYAIIVALIAHIGGALKHRLFDPPESDVLSRML